MEDSAASFPNQPPQIKRILFGINGLDRLIPSEKNDIPVGVPWGHIVLLRGAPGTGKTPVAIQILYSAILFDDFQRNENNPKGFRIYMPCEERDVIKQYENNFNWNNCYPNSNVKEMHINLPMKDRRIVENFETYNDFIIEQIKAALNDKPEVLAIDGLTLLQRAVAMSQFYGREEIFIRHFTLNLFAALKEYKNETRLIIITAEQSGTVEPIRCEEYLADMVIDFCLKETTPGMRQRKIEIKKARHSRQTLGEHSLWIIGFEKAQILNAIYTKMCGAGFRAEARPLIVPGISIFPRRSVSWLDMQKDISIAGLAPKIEEQRLGFGIPGLDEMLGSADHVTEKESEGNKSQRGLSKNSTTVIMGPTGTGKTLLGISYALEACNPRNSNSSIQGEARSLIISFDQRKNDLLRFCGDFIAGFDEKWLKNKEFFLKSTKGRTLQERHRQEKVIIHSENPVNIDVDMFLDFLELCLHKFKFERVFIDSVSDIERCMDHPERFTDFLISMFDILRETTSVITYETLAITGQTDAPETGVSYLADNVIATRHIPINDRYRKAIYIIKTRGSSFSNDVRELRIRSIENRKFVEVTRDLDLYTDLLVGTPRPIEVFLKLFWENKAEKEFNDEIVAGFAERYPNLRVSSFTKAQIEEVIETGAYHAFEAPKSNVKVVSLDEHWIDSFGIAADENRNPEQIAELHDIGCEIPRQDQDDIYYRLIQIARRERPEVIFCETSKEEIEDDKKSLYAVPNYLDFGLFCYRTDLLAQYKVPNPVKSWDSDPKIAANLLWDLPSIWHQIMKNGGGNESLCGFAFDMGTPSTFATVFTEFVWNFGARRNFLDISNPESKKENMICVARTIRYLHSLIHKYYRLLPFPCTIKHCARSVFSRHWYSTIQSLILDEGHSELIGKISLAPFPTSRYFRRKENIERLLKISNENFAKFQTIIKKYKEPGFHPPENKIHFVNLQIERLTARIKELAQFINNPESVLSDPSNFIYGSSCSGAWYLGVLQSSKTHSLPAALIREMVSPARSFERVKRGAGLPLRESFYRIFGKEMIPNLSPDWTFERLYHELMGRIRSRRSVLLCDSPEHSPLIHHYNRIAILIHRRVMAALGNDTDQFLDPYRDNAQEKAYYDNPLEDPIYADVVEPLYNDLEALINVRK